MHARARSSNPGVASLSPPIDILAQRHRASLREWERESRHPRGCCVVVVVVVSVSFPHPELFLSARARAFIDAVVVVPPEWGCMYTYIYMYIPTVLQLQAAHVHERRAARGSRETIDSPLYSLSLLYCTHRQRLCVALYIAARARAAEKELCALVNATRENVVSLCLFFLSDPFFAAF